MTPLEGSLRSLLRWYPRTWRDRHGDIMLATLLDDAEERGLARPTRADAWSIRAHGLAERATPRAAAVMAGIGVLLAAIVQGMQQIVWALTVNSRWQRIDDAGWVVPVAIVVSCCVVAPLIAGAIVMLAARRAAPSALLVGLVAVVAAGIALACAELWAAAHPVVTVSQGGAVTTGFPSLVAHAGVAAIVALGILPLVRSRLPLRDRHPLGWPVAVVCAAALGILGVTMTQTMLLLVVGIAIVPLTLIAEARRTAQFGSAVPRGWSPRIVGLLAAVAIVLALPMAALAILATFDAVPVAAAGMRLAAAVLVASGLVVVVAGAVVLRAWIGGLVWAPAAAFMLAIVTTAVAVGGDAARPGAEALLVVASAFVGLGMALVVVVAGAGGALLRVGSAIVVGVSAAALAPVLLVAAALAWMLAVPLGVAAIRRRIGASIREPA